MKYLEEYLDYLEYQKNYSKETIHSYNTDLIEFFDYLKVEDINFDDIDYDMVRMWLIKLNNLYDKSSTISRKISSLRSFYKYLLNRNIIKGNPFSLISLPKKDKHLPRFFYYNELEELFKVPDMKTPLGQRDRLILEMLYATGVRVSELVNIKVTDIRDEEITVLGKGNKERIVRFGAYAEDVLDIYINDGYKKLNIKNKDFIFINSKGGQLTTRGVRYILDKIIEKTTIDKKISPHMLRHSFATHMLNEGCDILTVQELLGHESLTATSIYTHITNDRLKEVYYKCHPRARK